jgi:hypothetical protein
MGARSRSYRVHCKNVHAASDRAGSAATSTPRPRRPEAKPSAPDDSPDGLDPFARNQRHLSYCCTAACSVSFEKCSTMPPLRACTAYLCHCRQLQRRLVFRWSARGPSALWHMACCVRPHTLKCIIAKHGSTVDLMTLTFNHARGFGRVGFESPPAPAPYAWRCLLSCARLIVKQLAASRVQRTRVRTTRDRWLRRPRKSFEEHATGSSTTTRA